MRQTTEDVGTIRLEHSSVSAQLRSIDDDGESFTFLDLEVLGDKGLLVATVWREGPSYLASIGVEYIELDLLRDLANALIVFEPAVKGLPDTEDEDG